MKKSRFFKFFSLILCMCLALFSFAGCTFGGRDDVNIEEGDDFDIEEENPADVDPMVLDGVKVLTRPENYDFDDAIGEYSENYFNIYSSYLLNYLYNVYNQLNSNMGTEEIENFFAGAETGLTKSLIEAPTDTDRLFYYDSSRYTIESVSTATDIGTNEITSQTIVLDTSTAWNWSIKPLAEDLKPYFYNDNQLDEEFLSISYSETTQKITINFLNLDDENRIYDSWTEISVNLQNYSSSYYGTKEDLDETEIADYFTSPFYSGEGINYFQDALEYAIYMITMGYTLEDDPNFFDFEITYGANGLVSGMKVGGWETAKINVSSEDGALAKAKEKYVIQSNYIGVTNENLNEITKFIIQKVIGENAYNNGNAFDVKDIQNGSIQTTPVISINRNYGIYDAQNDRYTSSIVANIVKYACEKAPIGYYEEDGVIKPLSLGSAFLTSKITDYEGDYFEYYSEKDEYGEEDDSNAFNNVEVAEYQSIVMFPTAENLGKRITEVLFTFEYYNVPEGSTKVIDTENGLSLNIGIRYFNCQTNEIVLLGEGAIVIPYAENGIVKDDPREEGELFHIVFSDEEEGDFQMVSSICLNTLFDNNIGSGIINAMENGQVEGIDPITGKPFKKSITLNGTSTAREYYKLNPSSTYGQYGTLNEEKFAGVCDFVEIYFDIDKDKDGASNKCYAFKVIATMIADEDADID